MITTWKYKCQENVFYLDQERKTMLLDLMFDFMYLWIYIIVAFYRMRFLFNEGSKYVVNIYNDLDDM